MKSTELIRRLQSCLDLKHNNEEVFVWSQHQNRYIPVIDSTFDAGGTVYLHTGDDSAYR